MITFDSGEKLNPTSLCYNKNGIIVFASQIILGEEAFTSGYGFSLGKRVS